MQLRNEVVVAAPPDRTWEALLDVPRVARALPGASVEADGVEGVYRGALKVRLGPVTVEYEGVARVGDVDEDERVASFHVQGREVRGHGGASATITNRVTPEREGTRVVVDTDLAVTGRAAQLGRGLMEDVAGRLLAEFATRLEREVLTGEPPPGPRVETLPETAEALDVGGAAWRPLARRFGPALVVAAGLVALAVVARRPRPVLVVVVERR